MQNKNYLQLLTLMTALFASASVLRAQPPAVEQGVTSEQLRKAIEPLLAEHKGEAAVSVCILDEAGRVTAQWQLAGDKVMPTASLIKFPVMIEAYRQAAAGQVSLDDALTLEESDKVPGSGILTDHFSASLKLSLRDAIRLMIRYSDNTATNLVANHIGLSATSKSMAEMGFPETQLHSLVFNRDSSVAPERSAVYGLGSTTASDMTELLNRLQRGELGTPAATAEMLAHLLACDDAAKLPSQLPAECKVAHKTGSVNRSRTAAGLVSFPAGQFSICVLTDKNEDSSWRDDNAAHVLIGTIAKRVYDLIKDSSPQVGDSDPESTDSTLRRGAQGELVESLQRTLNARNASDSGEAISVDGDFGPATEVAVRRFQSSSGLPDTGAVDAETWKQLGDLLTEDAPVPSPSEVNSVELPKAPPLDPNGVPQVSAKAFAMVNAATGEVIAQGKGEEPLPMASTTKIMTAYLVLELAQREPKILDEMVTFSKRADDTIGSTAGIRAGEQLPVGELLYGLLLPSGNDASVALAEHFGQRLQSQETGDSYEHFIAAMNSKASELGLSATAFRNPNGLTEDGHHSSAVDLARLAIASMKLPRMREIVACRQRGCRVTSSAGYSRNVLWENTNRLLQQSGFLGVKTGTTNSAGACLVACGSAAGSEVEFVVVVLGCPTSDARYQDARNLFAWAWRAL